MMELDGTASLSVLTLSEACLESCALLANDEGLDLVGDRLFSLLAIEAMADVTRSIFASVDQVAIVKLSGLHDGFVEVIVIDHDRHLHQLGLFERQNLLYRDGSDTLDNAPSTIDFKRAH